ncbi:sigma-70 family RNA polymerase sigma factor [Streptomyces sp. DSM 44915]|uniref:Sigma-70 family RNA polymerase sigma factor n=1 Tax=Streptomyces chisholmiae TaxID=3075540 RepID=A0ABU2JX41_9ACTN|nr:sigma-70 family RNA polymerase sigma factor [Streptomyces sp. DSM 44915]MDT0269566.1 sigma-70 family RNA polymerase sigma factor [Streptomyces sp. DSM 44915]
MTSCRAQPSPLTGRGPQHAASRSSRARRAARPAAYADADLDGLFTYCLSVMCEHDAAIAALGEALALAERQHERGRRPAEPELARPWLYALARWCCLRRLARQREQGLAAAPRAVGEDAQRRRELALLAWPEAAGTTQEQREALELAARHRLSTAEIARVLRLPEETAHALLTRATCEVERTRAALAAVDLAHCPAMATLSGDDRRVLLGPTLRRELVRHVDECPACRLVAQRALAGLGWPGTAPTGRARLAVVGAPRPAVHAARLAVRRARSQAGPRWDRGGFPLPEKDRAARRERLRGRAVTGTVVATVLAAPVLALWAAYRGAPVTGEAAELEGMSASVPDEPADDPGTGRQPAGERDQGRPALPDAPPADELTEEGAEGERAEPSPEASAGPGEPADEAPREPVTPAPGELSVDAVTTESGTLLTLTVSGGSPVSWSAASGADWLLLGRSSGTLWPGETLVIEVLVDPARQPVGPWRAAIVVEPTGTVVTVEGAGESPETEQPPPETEEPPAEEPTEPPADEPVPQPRPV